MSALPRFGTKGTHRGRGVTACEEVSNPHASTCLTPSLLYTSATTSSLPSSCLPAPFSMPPSLLFRPLDISVTRYKTDKQIRSPTLQAPAPLPRPPPQSLHQTDPSNLPPLHLPPSLHSRLLSRLHFPSRKRSRRRAQESSEGTTKSREIGAETAEAGRGVSEGYRGDWA